MTSHAVSHRLDSRMPSALFRAWSAARLAVLRPVLFGGARCRGPASRREVALTFDDGPDPDTTPAILDALDAAGARATFFFLAPRIAEHPELARRVLERHEVGTHLFSHDRQLVRTRAGFDEEARRAIEVHERTLGKRPAALRFPFGDPGRIRAADVGAHGMVAYHWTFSSEDSSAGSADDVVRHVVPRLHAGAIVLFHDGRGPGSTKGKGSRRPTVEALPAVLSATRELGLRAVTVTELFSSDAR